MAFVSNLLLAWPALRSGHLWLSMWSSLGGLAQLVWWSELSWGLRRLILLILDAMYALACWIALLRGLSGIGENCVVHRFTGRVDCLILISIRSHKCTHFHPGPQPRCHCYRCDPNQNLK